MSDCNPLKKRRENANTQSLKLIANTYEELKEVEHSKLEMFKVNTAL